ncbi:MAG: DUF4105 domain-containing protein [Muribaculaceae bacterium]|nr:DUF4105 domain-containing protein [Muribaculaceae bacterium]
MILFLLPLSIRGEERRDSVVVSLITCWPGSEVYELCGHEALRVRGIMNGTPVDSVWNYGVFDFNEPHFVYRFVKGETDYMLAGYPFAWFLPEYVQSGRRVLEQDLNLTPEEATRLVKRLQNEGLPQNRTYRYNYVRDNCATRIIDRVDEVTSKNVIYPDSVKYGSFRKEMRAYHKNYPWYQFGIDLALGSGIDIPIKGREEMFVPVEMAEKAAGAHFSDGRPLIKESRVLNQGVGDATLPPTPWYLTPLAICWLVFIIIAGTSFWMIKRKRIAKGVYTVWFAICGLAGSLIAFLVFKSQHEATNPNVLLLWLNPLQLILAITVWSRRMRILSYIVSYYNIIAVGLLLIVWQFQRQSANAAFFPMMCATLLLAVTFVYVAPKVHGLNKNELYTLDNKKKRTSTARKGGGRRKK